MMYNKVNGTAEMQTLGEKVAKFKTGLEILDRLLRDCKSRRADLKR